MDETHEIPKRRGNGKLRREIWVDASGKIARFNLAFINHQVSRGDNERVLGQVSSIDARDFEEVETMFEAEVQAYLKGHRQ